MPPILRIVPPAARDALDFSEDIGSAGLDIKFAQTGVDNAIECGDGIPTEAINLLRKARDKLNALIAEAEAV